MLATMLWIKVQMDTKIRIKTKVKIEAYGRMEIYRESLRKPHHDVRVDRGGSDVVAVGRCG